MKELSTAPSLVEQVRDAILAEILEGRMPAGTRVIQESIAQALGVSRQPVQQALLLLRNQGVLTDAPGRGLIVAAMDLDHVEQMYEIRSAIEGLAASLAATRQADRARKQGPALIEAGRKAVASGSVARMIAADQKFHQFIYELSGNQLIAPSMDSHWTATQRVMGEVLMRDERPRNIWDQHEAIIEAIAQGKAEKAGKLVHQHLTQAAEFMLKRLRQRD